MTSYGSIGGAFGGLQGPKTENRVALKARALEFGLFFANRTFLRHFGRFTRELQQEHAGARARG